MYERNNSFFATDTKIMLKTLLTYTDSITATNENFEFLPDKTRFDLDNCLLQI